MRQWGRPAADGAPDKTPHVVVAGTAAVDKPVEKTPLTAEPVGLELTGIEEKQTAEGGIETGAVSAAKPDGPPAAKAESGPPIESVGPGLKTEKDSPAGAPDSTKAARTEVIAPAEGPLGQTAAGGGRTVVAGAHDRDRIDRRESCQASVSVA